MNDERFLQQNTFKQTLELEHTIDMHEAKKTVAAVLYSLYWWCQFAFKENVF